MGWGSRPYLLPQEMKRQGEPREIERSLNRQAMKAIPSWCFLKGVRASVVLIVE